MAFYHWQQRQDDIDRCLVMKDIVVLVVTKTQYKTKFIFYVPVIFIVILEIFTFSLFHNINSIEPTVVNISAMSGIDLITFLMNDKFVKYGADFISNAWFKRQHALSY